VSVPPPLLVDVTVGSVSPVFSVGSTELIAVVEASLSPRVPSVISVVPELVAPVIVVATVVEASVDSDALAASSSGPPQAMARIPRITRLGPGRDIGRL